MAKYKYYRHSGTLFHYFLAAGRAFRGSAFASVATPGPGHRAAAIPGGFFLFRKTGAWFNFRTLDFDELRHRNTQQIVNA